jgi:hypothetical protein
VPAVWRAAARRFVLVLGGVAAGTAVVSLLVALALGSKIDRAVSVGFYLVGSFLLVAGFFVGNRGPARPKSAEDEAGAVAGMFGLGMGGRRLRWATREERDEAMANSAVFVTIGFALIVLGIVADERFKLF